MLLNTSTPPHPIPVPFEPLSSSSAVGAFPSRPRRFPSTSRLALCSLPPCADRSLLALAVTLALHCQVRLVFRRWGAHINWDEGAWSRGQRGGDSLTDRGLPSFMAATGGCPGLVGDELKTEESGDPVPVPNKRKKIQVAATELDGVSKISTEEKKQTGRMSTAAAEKYPIASSADPIGTPSPLRFRPYPSSGKMKNLGKRSKECTRTGKIVAKDPYNSLPTRKESKDPKTADAVQSPEDKVLLRRVAPSIVSVSSITHDGSRKQQCTGIVMGQRESNGKQNTIIVTCSEIICRMGTLLDPVPKLSVGLPNMTTIEGELLFFSDYYDIALLEINVDFPLWRPSIGLSPYYGQEVFVLARDEKSSLMARHGDILWLEESNYLGRNYQMFLSCEVPVCGNGGPVIDHNGNVTGMAFHCSPYPSMFSISTIITCVEMWLKFSRIARPIHGLGLRTMDMLDVSLLEEVYRDHNISSGFIVDTVSFDSAAEGLGICPGDVIVSLDEQRALTLPELENYLLSLGWKILNSSSSMENIKLEVYDLLRKSKRGITLPIEFSDA